MDTYNIANKTFNGILWIDFETRSKVNLMDVGAHRYCVDPSTKVLLTAYAFNDSEINVCEADNLPDELLTLLNAKDVLKVAHNAEFDMAVLKYVLGIEIRVSEWYDTAYAAAYYAHPRNLKNLAKRLNLTAKGEQDGVLLFSVPRKKSKYENAPSLFGVARSDFNEPEENPKEWAEFKTYAKQDVGTMREAFNAMPIIPEIEIFTSQITMEMNFNGVPFDSTLGNAMYLKALDFEQTAGKIALDKYGIKNLKSTQQVQAALRANNVMLTSLNKKERAGETHEILDLRDRATGSAFAKLPKAFARVCPDGRLHGELVGFGAHTGRWSSRGVQLQNWKRILSEVDETLENVKSYDHLAQHMRLCLGYVPNMQFTYADLSQIEARIVAWLAGSTWRMDAFAAGVDIYARSAEKMFNIKHVAKDSKERYYGKCAELGFGYGGGHRAIENIQPDFYASEGEDKIRELVQRWRGANPEITTLWRTLENAMKLSMRKGRETIMCGKARVTFVYDGKSGKVILPSGRSIYYRGLHGIANARGGIDLHYMDYSLGGTPLHNALWGGVLLENITQAIARDVLVDIMWRVQRLDLWSEVIATVHDEIWYLHSTNVPMLDILLDEMKRPITWANGLITKGDGLTSDRYRK
jgi:DNA polymerase